MPAGETAGYGLEMGTTTTEIELKLLLPSADAHARLIEHLDPAGVTSSEEQENVFFDTPTFSLRVTGLSLRLRESKTRVPSSSAAAVRTHTLTLKGKGLDDTVQPSVLSVRPEIELSISDDDAEGIHSGAVDPLHLLESHGAEAARILIAAARRAQRDAVLLEVGRFSNGRRHVPVKLALPSGGAGVTLEVDRTVFAPDDVAYEVELEIPDERDVPVALEFLHGLLRHLGIEGTSAPGKASRFFARLKEAR